MNSFHEFRKKCMKFKKKFEIFGKNHEFENVRNMEKVQKNNSSS